MKFSIFSFLVIAMFSFSSCQKGDTVKDELIKDDGKETDKAPCFDVVYPISYTMPDGTVISMSHEDDWSEIKAWYEGHDSAAKPQLNYPVQIVYVDKDGLFSINSEEEMILAKKDCFGEGDELKTCEWDGSKVSDTAVWEEHIIEPLVTSEDCGGCIVDGVVKYVKIDTDFAYLIYYGKGECDEWAFLVTYYGATSDKKEEKCKFKLDCDSGN